MKQIISASRRTDIISYHYEWLLKCIKQRQVYVENPLFKGKQYKVSLDKEDVHTLVLWSKDFKNFIANPNELADFNLYFQFTVNLYSSLIEPNVPTWNTCKKQLKTLIDLYGQNNITIRFDPILFCKNDFATLESAMIDRYNKLELICSFLEQEGYGRVRIVTSYYDMYPSSLSYMKKKNIELFTPTSPQLVLFFKTLSDITLKHGMNIYTCCETADLTDGYIKAGACLDHEILSFNADEKCTSIKDNSQRKLCNCVKSKDIGSYFSMSNGQICQHGCVYCYARKEK